jgi:hypothetical protein
MAAARVLGKESGGSDSRFFTTQKKGEMHELRLELHSTDRTVKVDAVKKVIASMTVGKDVSMLFTDVLNCVQTGNIGESSCKPAPHESLMRANERARAGATYSTDNILFAAFI